MLMKCVEWVSEGEGVREVKEKDRGTTYYLMQMATVLSVTLIYADETLCVCVCVVWGDIERDTQI